MNIRKKLAAAAREPLVHFLLLGAAVYALYGLMGPDSEQKSETQITVTATELDWLNTNWEKRWNRPPTSDELAGLIDGYVRETVLYREALAMGLDRDDTIIRRRLAQKLEFLSQDLVATVPPTEEELRAYFAEHSARYQAPALMTISQVFVDPDRHEDETLARAKEIVTKLRELEPPTQGVESLGDPFMLQSYYPERSEAELAKLFGREFAGEVAALSTGEWHGPLLSGYGVHLVYVEGRSVPGPPEFSELREKVVQDFEDQRRSDFEAAYYQSLLSRYEVVIEDGEGEESMAAVGGEAQ